ncbi:MAG: phosphoglycerate dehydrogenase [Christensenellales bacterium]
MYRIKVLNQISDVIYETLTPDKYEVSASMKHEDAILVRSTKCHEMEFSPNLLAIARAGAGTNNIPTDRCCQDGVVVFNTPGANANAVKELVFALMFSASRNVVEAVCWLRGFDKNDENLATVVEKSKAQFVGPELKGKKLGVIGLGSIGRMVANDAHAMGMEVYGYDPFISVDAAWGLSRAIHHAYDINEIFSVCDYITVHVPLMDKTNHFIGEKEIAKMKPTAMLLNLSRGEVVDTQAVVKAVQAKKIAKYITDFPESAVLGVDNILCVPHLGASTPESEENCAKMAAYELMQYLEYGNIINAVNMPSCSLPYCEGIFRITIIHDNVTNMVGQITTVLASCQANIANMINKSRGTVAYTILDLDDKVGDDTIERLRAISGVIRVRTI